MTVSLSRIILLFRLHYLTTRMQVILTSYIIMSRIRKMKRNIKSLWMTDSRIVVRVRMEVRRINLPNLRG